MFSSQTGKYRTSTAKKFLVRLKKISIFRVDIGLKGEYNKENLLEALK